MPNTALQLYTSWYKRTHGTDRMANKTVVNKNTRRTDHIYQVTCTSETLDLPISCTYLLKGNGTLC